MRHQLPGPAGEEAIRLCVVDLAARDRRDDALELGGVHLVVARHHGRDVDPLGEGALVARDDRGTDAAVPLVHDDLDPRVAHAARALGRCVA